MNLQKYVIIVLTILHNVISRSVKKRTCTTTADCGEGKICKRNTCRRLRLNDATNPLVLNEKYCVDQSDCPIGYFCDVKKAKCQQMRTTLDVMFKQPVSCRSVFKKFCQTTSQCKCSEKKMVCEDNECVVRKQRKPREKVCTRLVGQCDPGYICDCKKMRCRHIKDLRELKGLFRRCSATSQCRESEVCDGGVCKCSNKLQKRLTSKDCTNSSDCRSGYECKNSKCTKSIQQTFDNDV